MSGSSHDRGCRFGRRLVQMSLKGHSSPHASCRQLKKLRCVLHVRINGEGFQALQHQHQAPPKRQWQGCQRIIHTQTCISLDSSEVRKFIDPAQDRTEACRRESNIHWKHTGTPQSASGADRNWCSFPTPVSSPPQVPREDARAVLAPKRRQVCFVEMVKLNYRKDCLIQLQVLNFNSLLTMDSTF